MGTLQRLRWVLLGMLVGFIAIVFGALAGIPITGSAQPTGPASARETPSTGSTLPGLRIECRNDGLCVKSSETDWNDGQGRVKRRFLRVLVYYNGPCTAEECRVTLRSVAEVTAGGVRPSGNDSPALLIWSGDRAPRPHGWDLPPGPEPGVADLLYTSHRLSGDQITLKDEGYGTFLKYNTTYRIRLVASAEGVGEVGKNVEVRFGSAWDDFDVLSD